MNTADQGGSDPLLRLDVVTVFPDYLAPLHLALLGRAVDRGIVSIGVHDLRDWTHDVHRSVDDTPFGGGPGMVMRPTVWGEALDDLVGSPSVDDSPPEVEPPSRGDDERPLLIVPCFFYIPCSFVVFNISLCFYLSPISQLYISSY